MECKILAVILVAGALFFSGSPEQAQAASIDLRGISGCALEVSPPGNPVVECRASNLNGSVYGMIDESRGIIRISGSTLNNFTSSQALARFAGTFSLSSNTPFVTNSTLTFAARVEGTIQRPNSSGDVALGYSMFMRHIPANYIEQKSGRIELKSGQEPTIVRKDADFYQEIIFALTEGMLSDRFFIEFILWGESRFISSYLAENTALINVTASNGISISFDNPSLLSNPALTEVPIPAAFWLFGSALLALARVKRRT